MLNWTEEKIGKQSDCVRNLASPSDIVINTTSHHPPGATLQLDTGSSRFYKSCIAQEINTHQYQNTEHIEKEYEQVHENINNFVTISYSMAFKVLYKQKIIFITFKFSN